MFSSGPTLGYRLILSAFICLVLLLADRHLAPTVHLRNALGFFVTPVHWVAGLPMQLGLWAEESTVSRTELLDENRRLKNEALVLKQKVQQMVSLRAENNRLRELLNASEQLDDDVLVAELIGVDPDPYTHEVILNKGSEQGVFVGQPILDAQGLMGQVIEVLPYTSRVLLLADSNHAIPVQVNRNGLRSIVVGTGKLDELALVYVPDTADIRKGDLLVSSGLGSRYPKGYPVAEITKVEHDPGEPFAIVRAKPTAFLDRSRYLLMVFSAESRLPTIESEGL
ncbi:rod shape-determining protein MreC [Bermanella marisrubri]|uniref:rod shape-determining protein MreC n=1 Tax=Bermanella marisrubri TaxID=207949 RepID=UPI00058BEAA9|nr:rod shape-determining protein MreC [Bermanella marisrubri]QIZ85745.1 rod shape-determining protein MreC [Bermanella marisrubri]